MRNVYPEALVLRTSWIYSPYGHNFVKTMLRFRRHADCSRRRRPVGTPTAANDLADAILDILGQLASGERSGIAGIYHLAAQGETTWHGFAAAIFAGLAAGREGSDARPDHEGAISDRGAPAGQFTARLQQDGTSFRRSASALAARSIVASISC